MRSAPVPLASQGGGGTGLFRFHHLPPGSVASLHFSSMVHHVMCQSNVLHISRTEYSIAHETQPWRIGIAGCKLLIISPSAIQKVQDWLGYANISTTRQYDRLKSKPEDSPTFRVQY